MRVRNRSGVAKWPVIRVHPRKARVTLSGRTLSARGLIWWKRILRIVGAVAKLGILVSSFSLVLPEALYMPDALQWLLTSIVAFILSRQDLLLIGRMLLGNTTKMEWNSDEVIVYPHAGWLPPKIVKREHLRVVSDLQPMDEAREAELRSRVIQPGQNEDISGAIFSNCSWVTVSAGNHSQRVTNIWGHHAKLFAAGILSAEALFLELTEAKEVEKTAHVSAAE